MLYLIHGSDIDKSKSKTDDFIESFRKENNDAEVFKIESETWTAEKMEHLIESRGLFQQNHIVIINRISENELALAHLLNHLDAISKSKNLFILREIKTEKEVFGKIEESAQKIENFEKIKKEIRPDFNIFSLTDALLKKDRKNLWILFERALMKKIPAEEIFPVLFWQIKTMALAQKSKNAKEAGLKDFPFNKAKSASKNFSENEVSTLSNKLISSYHNARRTGHSLENEIEKFILTIK